jgi:lauroyl/myristoyl acyltransferase/predicted exporter
MRSGWISVAAAGVVVLIAILGLHRLRLSTDVLGLLPDVPEVQALRLWETSFSGAHELRITLSGNEAGVTAAAARRLAQWLENQPGLAAQARWQAPWRDDEKHGADLIAWRWVNGPPGAFEELAVRVAPERLATTIREARQALQFSLSPEVLARRAHDPLGLTDLPGAGGGLLEAYQQEGGLAAADGTFRVVLVRPASPFKGFDDAGRWIDAIRAGLDRLAAEAPEVASVRVRLTGGPAIAVETSRQMERDMRRSVAGTAVIVALVFGWAHRRLLPLVWLLGLVAVILVLTVGLAGWVVGALNVVSLGFAAILLGLAVDYGLVLHQEIEETPAAAREIRASQARPILFSALTTAAAFGVLNFAGVPGMAQLATLIAIGVLVAAAVMLVFYVQPFLRRGGRAGRHGAGAPAREPRPLAWVTPGVIVLIGVLVLWRRPSFDATPAPLRPVDSESYAALEEMQSRLGHRGGEILLVFRRPTDAEIATDLARARALLERWQEAGRLESFQLPDVLWPNAEHWRQNRALARDLSARRDEVLRALTHGGFTARGVALTRDVFSAWTGLSERRAPETPPGETGAWAWNQIAAHAGGGVVAVGGATASGGLWEKVRDLNRELNGVLAGSWDALGPAMRDLAIRRIGPLVLVMLVLMGIALGWAFRDARRVLLGLGALAFSGGLLWGVMAAAGWSWNLMNVLALPVLLGTGIDYSIHQLLSLARHRGDLASVRRTTGRALWLCGMTTIAGFGSLAWSGNAGLASLGKACAAGIASALVTAQFLLPGWWVLWGRPGLDEGRGGASEGARAAVGVRAARGAHGASGSSRLYQRRLWGAAVWVAGHVPRRVLHPLACQLGLIYAAVRPRARKVVESNLEPVVGPEARAKAPRLFAAFAGKLVDLWRFEAGQVDAGEIGDLRGGEHLERALESGRGVLLVTVHLGNWELGAPLLARFERRLLVVTQPEPGGLTELRVEARRALGVDTLVLREDPFAFVEVIRRLEAGGMVAMLVDRPQAESAMAVEFFGRRALVSRAPAELARATGCVVLPVYVVSIEAGYCAEVLPAVPYDRASLRRFEERVQFGQQILRVFEPVVRQHSTQWYQFAGFWRGEEGRGSSRV